MKILFCWLLSILPFLTLASSKSPSVTWSGDTLSLSNQHATHKFLWDGNLSLLSIQSHDHALGLEVVQPKPDLHLAGGELVFNKVSVQQGLKQDFPNENAYLWIELMAKSGDLLVKYQLRMYENSGAVRHQVFFKGKSSIEVWEPKANIERQMIENSAIGNGENSRFGMLPGFGQHSIYEIVSFKEATDYHDDPLRKHQIVPFRQAQRASGNLIIARESNGKRSIWLIKESPIDWSQVNYPGYDFSVYLWGAAVNGFGVIADRLEEGWKSSYAFARGLSIQDNFAAQSDWLTYQMQLRKYNLDRDAMVLSNTWGDRSQDSRMNEAFILQEIRKAAELGISHLQLDDGWQQGLSKNSASKAGMKWDDWTNEDWQPHKDRFPNGFDHIVQVAKEQQVELCLWFNPSKSNDYANWQRDAEILIAYYEKYGIKVFKIDGLELGSLEGEMNLRKFFDRVMEATQGKATFNLDVTAGRRVGYHFMQEYGNVFLENRYTDWGNYFPYRTLRNLWLLSAYVPSSRLQIEWLNVGRNQHKYAPSDPHAPAKVGLNYALASTMAAQPLAWMELSGLSSVDEIQELLEKYKELSKNWHKMPVLPVGLEPNGNAWSGFWLPSSGEEGDYLLVYKEAASSDEFVYALPKFYKEAALVFGSEAGLQLQGPNIKVQMDGSYQFAVVLLRGK